VWVATVVAAIAALAGFLVSVTGDYYTVARFSESAAPGTDPVLKRLAERLHLGDAPLLLPAVRETPDTGGYVLWYVGFAMFVAFVYLAGWYRPANRIPVEPLTPLFPVLRRIPAWIRHQPPPVDEQPEPPPLDPDPDPTHAGRRTPSSPAPDPSDPPR
jgi:hypothetical protein